MKIAKAYHKAFLYKKVNFSDDNTFRQYPLDRLDVAMSVSKKLALDAIKSQENGNIEFVESEQELTPEEQVFLKEIIKEIKKASIDEGEVIKQLKELLGM